MPMHQCAMNSPDMAFSAGKWCLGDTGMLFKSVQGHRHEHLVVDNVNFQSQAAGEY